MPTQFNSYVDSHGRSVVEHWLDRGLSYPQRETARAALKDTLRLLKKQPRTDWSDRHWKKMTGGKDWEGIFEIRFKTEQKVLYRILAMYGPGEDNVTMLVPAVKASGALPKGIASIAQERRREVQQGVVNVRAF